MVLESINFGSIVSDLESAGFYEVLLPFMLVFTLIFGILEKINIFGQESHKLNVVIALVAGFLIVRETALVGLINRFLPNVSMFVIIIIGFLIVLGIFGIKSDNWGGGLLFVFVIVAVVGVIWGIKSAAEQEGVQWLPIWLDITERDLEIIGFVGAALVVMWFVIARKKTDQEYRFFKGFQDIGDAFRGGKPK